MKARPCACLMPAGSLITPFIPGASFHDASAIVVAEGHLSALDHFLQALRPRRRRQWYRRIGPV